MDTRQTQWGGCRISQRGGSVTSWSPLPSDPEVTNRYTSSSSTSRSWLMKMHGIRKLLCYTDNLDMWRSDRALLWNHFPLYWGRLARLDVSFFSWICDGKRAHTWCRWNGLCQYIWTASLNLLPIWIQSVLPWNHSVTFEQATHH